MNSRALLFVHKPRPLYRLAFIYAVAWGMPLLTVAPALSQPSGQEVVSPEADKQAEAERNRDIVRRAFEAWANGESVFNDLLADDVVWTIHGSDPVAGTYNGRKDFVSRASAPLVRRLQTPVVPEVHAIWAEGDVVIVRFDGSATTTSGAPYRNEFVWIFWMKKGVVTRAEAFLDLAAYREAVSSNEPKEG
uniref:nuclear transport factor 2 family protein n=1 Tax=Halomonas sp. TaxID=1486246 RepID=UPI00261456F2|nr:nuclear transport factor 2 family protein [Halomonas sp.]